MDKKQKITIITLSCLVVIGGGIRGYKQHQNNHTPKSKTTLEKSQQEITRKKTTELKKKTSQCNENQCFYNKKCTPLVAHAQCITNDKNNARKCDQGYTDTGISCIKNTATKGPKSILGYDIHTDSSLTKFVGRDHPFNNKAYAPKLTKIGTSQGITTRGTHYLRPEANASLQSLAKAFFQETGKNLHVISSYRSYLYQKKNISQSCKNSGRCARGGESEHQSGLTVDLRALHPSQAANYQKELRRLKNNTHLYGRHQSYQKGKIVDGYHPEWWHWRYLGKGLATTLHNQGITFSQLYKKYEK